MKENKYTPIKTVYIAGKVTGMESQAHYIFNSAETKIKRTGMIPINPMKLPHNHDKTWQSYMRECIRALMECDYIYMLPNWKKSKGARIERLIAWLIGIKRIEIED